MRRIKRILAVLLIIQFLIPSIDYVTAAGYKYESEALVLHELGLYQGGSGDYFDPDLGSQLQRQSAIILLVRLFGKEKAALGMAPGEVESILSKYTDNGLLADFARPYMAFAIKTGMSRGTSNTTLGPSVLIDSPSFACMILRNMGYNVDAPAFSHSLDILGSLAGVKIQDVSAINNKILIRDDVVGIMFWALKAVASNGDPLIISLMESDSVKPETAVGKGLVEYVPSAGTYRIPATKPKPQTDRDVVYGLIRDALLGVSGSVVLPANTASDTIGEINSIIRDVIADNPNILYYSGLTFWPNSRLVEFSYSKDSGVAKSHMALVEKKAQSIVSSIIKPDMLEYQKELAIHDYLISNCRYDTKDNPPPESFSAYGALCVGKAVCEGYSEAMQILLEKAGVECLTVGGTVKVGNLKQGHSWNIVRIYGQYYQLDATWDDPVMDDGSDMMIHTYFNLTDREMSKDHFWDTGYPACGATICNYYDYNGLVAKGYNAFVSFVVNKYNQGCRFITVKVSGTSAPGFDVTSAVNEILKTTHSGVTIRPVDNYGIIDLWFE